MKQMEKELYIYKDQVKETTKNIDLIRNKFQKLKEQYVKEAMESYKNDVQQTMQFERSSSPDLGLPGSGLPTFS